MTTPRRLRRDQRERTPKVVLRYTGPRMLTRDEAMAVKAQFKRAGDVVVVSRDWDVITPQRERDWVPAVYDEPPSPWVDAVVAIAGILAVLGIAALAQLVVIA